MLDLRPPPPPPRPLLLLLLLKFVVVLMQFIDIHVTGLIILRSIQYHLCEKTLNEEEEGE